MVGGGGGAEPGMGDAAPAGEASAGVLATTAYRKAMQRGDDAAAFEAFKEMLAAADDELGGAEPMAEELPPV